MLCPAMRTDPFSVGQFESFVLLSAGGTQLTGWEKPARRDYLTAGYLCFVFKLTPKFKETHVKDGTRKAVVFDHAGDVQILNPD